MGYSKTVILGYAGKDPEVGVTRGDNKVTYCNISMGCSLFIAGKRETAWYDITFWGKEAENAYKFLRKGFFFGAEGVFIKRTYKTQAGERSRWILNAESLILTPTGKERIEDD
jgi:single-strand DNA-binding protein